jgi:hypothetical protein
VPSGVIRAVIEEVNSGRISMKVNGGRIGLAKNRTGIQKQL